MKKILGERIKEEREAQGLSRAALQVRSGVPISTIQGVEDGKYDVTLVKFVAITDGLNRPVTEFLRGFSKFSTSNARTAPTPAEALAVLAEALTVAPKTSEDALLKRVANMTPEEREDLRIYLEAMGNKKKDHQTSKKPKTGGEVT